LATLTLEINTATKEFALTGSDTGVSEWLTSPVKVTWQVNNAGVVDGGTLNRSGATVYTTSAASADGFALAFSSSSGGTVSIFLFTNNVNSITVTGSDAAQSYAELGSNDQARLEALIGQSFSFVSQNGSNGFSSMSVAAVPEPRMYAALAALAALGWVAYRRRKV